MTRMTKNVRNLFCFFRSVDMWICGYKNGTQWYWRGEHIDVPLNIAAWVTGQPDNYGGRQGCVSVISDKAHWTVTNPVAWHEIFGYDDAYCDQNPQRYICERASVC